MKKNLLFTFLLALFGTSVAQRTIHVEDDQLLSACNEPIVMRGVNEMYIWSQDKQGSATLPEIAKTGANTVRLVWTSEGKPSDLDALITNCLANKMIPVAELHDATGDFSKLQTLLDYWKSPEVLAIVQKHKQWIIVNIGNEVGSGSETNAQWAAYYKDAITQLRDAGYDVPLMIDCGNYGSNEDYFLSEGNALLAHDPLHNLIFSVHTYWITPDSDQGRKDRLDSLISKAKQKNLPFIIGEGPQKAASPWSTYCEVDFPYNYLIKRCQEESIGWLAWSWGLVDNNDCGAPNSVFDITTDGDFGNWASTFAEEIMISDPNSIQNTSIIPASMLGSGCGEKCSPVELVNTSNNLCATGTALLSTSNAISDKHTVKWYFNNVLIDTAQQNSILANKEGTYRIEVDSLGACLVFDDVYLKGSIDIDLGDDIKLCTNNETTLSVHASDDDYTFKWYVNDLRLPVNKNQITTDRTGTYKVIVFNDYCEATDSVIVSGSFAEVNDASICANIPQTLHVEGTGLYAWYSDSELSNKLGTGNSITTTLTEATTLYIRDESGFAGKVGKAAIEDSYWDTWDDESKTNKLGFEVFENITVKSFDIYAASKGAMNVIFYNASLAPIDTLKYDVEAGLNTLILNKEFTEGIYFADVAGSEINLQFNHDEGNYTTAFPYTLRHGSETLISIDRSEPSWMAGKPWYLFFYNWSIVQQGGNECLAEDMKINIKTLGCPDPTGTKEETSDLNIYPNPAYAIIYLSHSTDWQLRNINGELLQVGTGTNINIQHLENGLYFLKAENHYFKIQKQ